jgi:hypothetical protein
MVYLTVRITERSQVEAKKLEMIVQTWDIKIVKQEIDKKQKTLRLTINASMPSTMSLIISIAQSRFQEDLLESNMSYEYDYPLE